MANLFKYIYIVGDNNMAIHVARLGLVHITATGSVKQHTSMTIGEAATSSSEIRVLVDSGLANTAGYPTVEAYLALEDASGFGTLRHLDQSFIITANGDASSTPPIVPSDAYRERIALANPAVSTEIPFGNTYDNVRIWLDSGSSAIYLSFDGTAATTSDPRVEATDTYQRTFGGGISSFRYLGAGVVGFINVEAW